MVLAFVSASADVPLRCNKTALYWYIPFWCFASMFRCNTTVSQNNTIIIAICSCDFVTFCVFVLVKVLHRSGTKAREVFNIAICSTSAFKKKLDHL